METRHRSIRESHIFIFCNKLQITVELLRQKQDTALFKRLVSRFPGIGLSQMLCSVFWLTDVGSWRFRVFTICKYDLDEFI